VFPRAGTFFNDRAVVHRFPEVAMRGMIGIPRPRAVFATLIAAALYAATCVTGCAQTDPLPSWNEGAAKKSIPDFVARVRAQDGVDFVPPEARIATA
jgi:hypothetical protein